MMASGSPFAAPAPELLVVSDTHGDAESLAAVLAWARGRNILKMAFLGDGDEDVDRAFRTLGWALPCAMVRGNNDWDAVVPHAYTLEFAGKKFFMTHGHLCDAYYRLDPAIAMAKSAGADALLYGHTHRAFWEEMDGLLVLNPGSLSRPRDRGGPSFATVRVPSDGWFEVQVWRLAQDAFGRLKPVRATGTD